MLPQGAYNLYSVQQPLSLEWVDFTFMKQTNKITDPCIHPARSEGQPVPPNPSGYALNNNPYPAWPTKTTSSIILSQLLGLSIKQRAELSAVVFFKLLILFVETEGSGAQCSLSLLDSNGGIYCWLAATEVWTLEQV